ncbi:MAG: hypothetical protein IKK09_08145 [Clostridia bacterium]|nr:hypothetical protein [Clostridia bacterium]
MAYIMVDHRRLETTASDIDGYISAHRRAMLEIDNNIVSLGSSWQGEDYYQMQREWNEMKNGSSTSEKMLKSLDSYADFLRWAAKKYKQAQTDAINRANKL